MPLVVDKVFGSIEIDVTGLSALPWQEACKVFARSMFDGLRRHRNVAPLLAADLPIGPNALATRERMVAFLLGNGFPPALAAKSYATLARYILGFVMQLSAAHHDDDDEAALALTFRTLDPSEFPATVAVADHLPVPLDEEFDFGLDLIVEGLAQALRHPRFRGV